MKRLSRRDIIILTISSLIWLLYIIFDAIYSDHLFRDSGEFVIRWQQRSGESTQRGFKALSYTLDVTLGVSGFLLYLFSSARIKFFKLASYGIFSTYANICVRLMYAEPRPYMAFDRLKIYECINDFGSPSGHLFTATTVYYCLFHMYLIPWTQNRNTNKNAIIQGQPPVYNDDIKSGGNYKFGIVPLLLWILCLIIIFAIGVSRIYLGDHSYNQIVLGFVYSTSFTIFLFIVVDEPYGRFLERIVQRPRSQNKGAFIGVTIFFVIFLVVPIIIFESQKAVVDYRSTWLRNIWEKCEENNLNQMLLGYDFANTGIIMLLMGGLYSLLLTNGWYERRYKAERPFSFWKEVLRIVILAIFASPWLFIMQFVDWSNPYLNFFVGHCLMYFLVFTVVYALLPHLYSWAKIDRQGDLLRQTPPTIPAFSAPAGPAPQAGAVVIPIGAAEAGRQVHDEGAAAAAASSTTAGEQRPTAEPRALAEVQPATGPQVIAEPIPVPAVAAGLRPATGPQPAAVIEPQHTAGRVGDEEPQIAAERTSVDRPRIGVRRPIGISPIVVARQSLEVPHVAAAGEPLSAAERRAAELRGVAEPVSAVRLRGGVEPLSAARVQVPVEPLSAAEKKAVTVQGS